MVESKPDVFAEVLRRLTVIEAEVDAIREELRGQRNELGDGAEEDD